jgi:cytochrome P450
VTPTPVFDPYSPEFFADPHEIFRRLREDAPVYYNPDLDFYALTRHDDVAAAYRDHTAYSSARGLDLEMINSGDDPPPVILFMDPPEHGRMRGLVSRAFTPRATAARRVVIGEVAQRFLHRADPNRFDVVQDFSAPFPAEVIAAMTGVPEEYRQQIRRWTDDSLRFRSTRGAPDEACATALVELFSYYYKLVEHRRSQPGEEDIISILLAATLARDDGTITRLEDLEVAAFAALLGGAGAVTVTKLIASAIANFATHPDQWRCLVDDSDLIGNAVEEVLRFDGPVLYNVRCTRTEVTVRGVTIPAGKPVLLCGAAANRDPEAFANPDTFDIGRDRSKSQHLGLGYGIHSCLGAAMARLQTTIALEHLRNFMPRYEVIWTECRRVQSTNESGWSHLPVRVLR